MVALRQFLFGPPRLERDGALVVVERRKVSALLAYLAVTGQPHTRDALATLLWPDADQSRARGALRRDLSVLHGLLGDEGLLVQGQTVSVQPDANLWVDVAEFQRLMAVCQTHGHSLTDVCADCVSPLIKVTALYQDDFLAGFTLRDSPDFDHWQLLQTEHLRRELASALERLARMHGTQRDFERAITYARRWLTLDLLHEPAHRQLMRSYAQAGQRAAALRQYDECERILERELGLAPERATLDLYQAIKDNHVLSASAEAWSANASRPKAIALSPRESAEAPLNRIVRGRIVGRERELAQARALWHQTRAGEGKAIFISGEPGVGKTRLMRELTNEAATTARVFTCECRAEGGAPYAPFAHIISDVIGDARDSLILPDAVLADLLTLAPNVRTRYADVPRNPPLEPQWEQERIYDSVVALCDAIAAPLLVCIEDAHWADSGTLTLLRHLIRQARTRRWMMVVTYRETELEANQSLGELLLDLNRERLVETLALKRLDREETRELLTTMLTTSGGISTDFLDGVHRETEGNPFFVEEVCKALIADGKLYYADGQWLRAPMRDISIPPSVRAAILSRVEKLPMRVQEMLRCAAVLGREFDIERLKPLSELDEEALVSGLDYGVRAQLISETQRAGQVTFTFAHALIPFALRESLSGLRLQRLHRHAVAVIEQLRPDDVEALAHHSMAGGERDKAIAYARRAADRALNLYAYDIAAQHLHRALALLEADGIVETRVAVLEALADVHTLLGQRVEAIESYQQALEGWRALSNADKWMAVRLYRKMGETFTSIRSREDVQRLMEGVRLGLNAALRLTDGEPPQRETVRLLVVFTHDFWTWYGQDWAAIEQYAQAAVRMAEQLDAPSERSIALYALATALGAREQFRERAQVAMQRAAITHDPRFLDLRERVDSLLAGADALMNIGEYAQARSYLLQGESLAQQMRDLSRLAYAVAKLGECCFYLDRWDETLEFAMRRHALVQQYGLERIGRQCFYCGITASVHALRGEREQSVYWRDEAMNYMAGMLWSSNIEMWPRAGRY